MTKSDGKYPNKEDLEPKVKGIANSDELPLADPSDSNTSDVFRKNTLVKTGEDEQSAFGTYKTTPVIINQSRTINPLLKKKI